LFADNLLVKLGIFDAMGWVYGGVGAGLCTVGVSVGLGLLLGYLIENPILAWRNHKLK
jgi:peptidoglycan/LPS O-acetylase OafA/YrhL